MEPDAQAKQRLVDHMEELGRELGIGWEVPPNYPPDQFLPLTSVDRNAVFVGTEPMIPVRFLPSVSVDRDKAVGILDNLIALGFIADASQLRIALKRFFAVKDWTFLVPTWNDDEGWKELQRRYVQPLRFRGGQLAAVLAEVIEVVKKSIRPTSPDDFQAPAAVPGSMAASPAAPSAANPPEATTEPTVAAGRGAAPRDDWFLEMHKADGTETYHSPKAILEKWNAMGSNAER